MPAITAGALAASAGIGAAGGLLNSGIQGAINYGLQKDAQAFNAEQASLQRDWSSNEAQLNRDFTERMSSTAKQREVADLKAAGLNPALANGGGAGFPGVPSAGGSTATSTANRVGSPDLGSFFDTAAKKLIDDNKDELFDKVEYELSSSAKQVERLRKQSSVINVNDIKVDPNEDLDNFEIGW